MKKFTFLALAFAAVLVSCDKSEDNEPQVEYDVITFEGSEWDGLVPSSQAYGDAPLYSNTQYTWSDNVTGLSGCVNADPNYSSAAGSWYPYLYAYSVGGSAISNYTNSVADVKSADEDEYDSAFNLQLAAPIGGYNSSENFLVAYSPATLTFTEAKTIGYLYVTNTSYTLYECTDSNSYVGGLNATDYVTVTFEGFNAEGNSVGSVDAYLATNGVAITDWKKVNLSSLGEVASIEITCTSSNGYTSSYDNVYYSNVPSYVAIDNIAVVKADEE